MRHPLAVIAVSVFLNFAGFTLIVPVLPFVVARHVAPADVAFWVALILAVFALCSFVAAPVLGALSDRYGRRPVLLLSLCGSAVGFAVFGIGGALWVLVLGRVIEGLTAGSISAMYAYVADTHSPEQRGPAFGKLGAAGGLGFMLGPVLGGLLGQVSLSAPLYGAAALALVNTLMVQYCLKATHANSAARACTWASSTPSANWRRHCINRSCACCLAWCSALRLAARCCSRTWRCC